MMQALTKTTKKYLDLFAAYEQGQGVSKMMEITRVIGAVYRKTDTVSDAERALLQGRLDEVLYESGEHILLGEAMSQQALTWLNNLRRTPKGRERANNPFGYREEKALDTFKEVRWVDVYHVPNRPNQILPVFRVLGTDEQGGEWSFDYYMENGRPAIVG